jgi:hypothetical protein
MINLLPNSEKKKIIREARLRLLIVVLVIFFLLELVLAVVITPSYILLTSNVKTFEAKLDDITNSAAPQAAGIEKSLTSIKNQLTLLTAGTTTIDIPPSTLLSGAIGAKTAGITLNSAAYSRTSDNKVAIQLSGVAALQEDLLVFQNTLKKIVSADVKYDQGFITKKTNIDFRITISYK